MEAGRRRVPDLSASAGIVGKKSFSYLKYQDFFNKREENPCCIKGAGAAL